MSKLYYLENKFPNGTLEFQAYYLDKSMMIYHNDDGSAYISYYECGNKKSESYYLNDKCQNTNGPTKINYYENGDIKSQYYYLNNKWLENVNSLEELQRYIKLNNIS